MRRIVVEEAVASARAVGWPQRLNLRERLGDVLDDGFLIHNYSLRRCTLGRHCGATSEYITYADGGVAAGRRQAVETAPKGAPPQSPPSRTRMRNRCKNGNAYTRRPALTKYRRTPGRRATLALLRRLPIVTHLVPPQVPPSSAACVTGAGVALP